MKSLLIGFALALGLTATSASAQHRHHHRHWHPHYPTWHHNHGWIAPALIGGGTVVYLATRPQQIIAASNIVVIDGVTYTRQIMLVNGIETEVLVRQ
jgi:hypothetical protein